MEFFNNVADWIKMVLAGFNTWLRNTLNFDGRLINFYNTVISPIAEWIKIVGFVFVLIFLVFGVFGFIKKLWKLALVLLIIIGALIIIVSL